jgi:hypothetical protein
VRFGHDPSRFRSDAVDRSMTDSIRKDLVRLDERIRAVRGFQVIVDSDLAEVFGVPTKALNQAVRRNPERFPADFAFQLTQKEMVILRSQIVTSSSGHGGRRHSAWVFTEHGALMAASVLSSPRAFVRLRDLTRGHSAIAATLAALERKVVGHDDALREVFAALRVIIGPPQKNSRPIGFQNK